MPGGIDPAPALAGWAACCREHGLAFTAPRQAIVRALLEADGALDAVGVLQAARGFHAGTSLGTTYRFLRELELHGLARAQPQPHGRMRWRLPAVQASAGDDKLRPLLAQLRHILRELERLGFAGLPAEAGPAHRADTPTTNPQMRQVHRSS